MAASEKLRARKVGPAASLFVIDVGASTWQGVQPLPHGEPLLPKVGTTSLSRKRMTAVHEMCRSIQPRCFDFHQAGVSQTEFFHAVGNAMSANVLARLFDRRALHAAGLTQCLREPHGDGA